jgi:hypothetical protein
MSYAEGTTVSPEQSQMEISKTLRRYGASGFGYGWEGDRAMITFIVAERKVRFELDLPSEGDSQFATTPGGRVRTDKGARKAAWEGEIRRRWRALALAIKAKLEAVETGITTFEEEFLAHLVLPDDTVVGPRVVAEVERAWRAGVAPPRLLALPAGEGS